MESDDGILKEKHQSIMFIRFIPSIKQGPPQRPEKLSYLKSLEIKKKNIFTHATIRNGFHVKIYEATL